ncbi:MAG TPA: glycosyltransferase family 4 protein [Gaiellaceae bacterium]|nr:glycosyltransferase family 4 protein [Gaiellaceae bacterium]
MKVLVLTTSYPRAPADVAGRFVAEAVERLRARGVDVAVVSPADFEHHGVAYGSGIVGNLRADPALAFRLPSMLRNFRRAAARAAQDVDLVHAHWLPSAWVGASVGKPVVAQVWGTDVALAQRLPWAARSVFRHAAAVVAPSTELARDAARLGARNVRVIPSGTDVVDDVPAPDEPPHVLYAGRLSREKGILELVEAARGLPLVVVGDGPLRARVPGALGMLPHDELVTRYARASVVACPSHREGFGVVCAEAMAHGRAVVASRVGGLVDLVADGESGLLVEPGDVAALRAALERLLGDPELRTRLGRAGRERIRERFTWASVTDATIALYDEVLGLRATAQSESPNGSRSRSS